MIESTEDRNNIKRGQVVVHASEPGEYFRVISEPYSKEGALWVNVGLISSVDEKTMEYKIQKSFPITGLVKSKIPE